MILLHLLLFEYYYKDQGNHTTNYGIKENEKPQ